MDNAHVALVSLFLNSAGFDDFRCDRGISLGFKVESMVKVRCRQRSSRKAPF